MPFHRYIDVLLLALVATAADAAVSGGNASGVVSNFTVSSLFFIDADTTDDLRYMAMAVVVFSTVSGFAPNAVLTARSALFLSQCIQPQPGKNTPMQLPMVVSLGVGGDWEYYFGAAVLNIGLIVGLSAGIGALGLMIASVRGVNHRVALTTLRYPSYLLVVYIFMQPQAIYSATVAASQSPDATLVALSSVAISIWFVAIAVTSLLMLWRFRAVYVRRLEAIDASGNITTIRRKIRTESDQQEVDALGDIVMDVTSWRGTSAANTSFSFSDTEHTPDHTASIFSMASIAKLSRLTAALMRRSFGRRSEAAESLSAPFRAESEENMSTKHVKESLQTTDAALQSMFSNALRVGSEKLTLTYTLRGLFEWVDDDDDDRPMPRLDKSPKALAAQGYVARFGYFFVYYTRTRRFTLMLDLAVNGLVAVSVGMWPSDDGMTNCYVQSGALFGLMAVHSVLVLVLGPLLIGRINNMYYVMVTLAQLVTVVFSGIASASEQLLPSQAATVVATGLVFTGAVRALVDMYFSMSQILQEASEPWPAIAMLSHIHIKAYKDLWAWGAERLQHGASAGPPEVGTESHGRPPTAAQEAGLVSRAVPEQLLPFNMVPLRRRPAVVTEEKAALLEQRRMAILRQIRLATSLHKLQMMQAGETLLEMNQHDQDLPNDQRRAEAAAAQRRARSKSTASRLMRISEKDDRNAMLARINREAEVAFAVGASPSQAHHASSLNDFSDLRREEVVASPAPRRYPTAEARPHLPLGGDLDDWSDENIEQVI